MRCAIRIDSASLSLSREVQFACNFAAVNWLWRNRSAGPSRLENSQVAESDFTKMLADAEVEEETAQKAYEKVSCADVCVACAITVQNPPSFSELSTVSSTTEYTTFGV